MKLKKITVLLIIVMLLSLVEINTVFASFSDEIKYLNESGKKSSTLINQTVVDLVYISSGDVTTHTYIGELEDLTVNSFDVIPQDDASENFYSAIFMIRRLMYDLINDYSPETELAFSVSDDKKTVQTYTYGQDKNEATFAIVTGLEDCLNDDLIVFERELDELRANGKMSNDDVSSIYVDISCVTEGTVTSTVYSTVDETKDINTFDVTPQAMTGANGARDKLVRFFFFFRNNNRDVPMCIWGNAPEGLIIGLVYGERKSEILTAYVEGIPECLGNIRLYTSSTPTTSTWAEKYLTTTFTINESSYSMSTVGLATDSADAEILSTETKIIDVKSYIKNNRFYVPVRYLAYSLGITEKEITWNNVSKKAGISKDDIDIILTIDSATMIVNGEPVLMDVSPEITKDRTMLPARWVAEALGASVEWNEENKEIIIKISQEQESE